MRNAIAIFFFVVICIAFAFGDFFDVNNVNEIRLTFSEQNWDEILDSLYTQGHGDRLTGTAVINGKIFDSVGVRYKGHSSYHPSRRKNPFNIKLDYRKQNQTIDGHGTLRLANVYKDPSFVREVLSYEIARKYMPAGRSNFTNIYVNDALIGLYTNNEDVDKLFMRSNFYCDENARFKGQIKDDSLPMIGWKYLGSDSTDYLDYFELESDTLRHWQELVNFLSVFNNNVDAVEQVLNIDRHLWMLAFQILLVNLDSPINTAQNFYLYQDASGCFNPIVWDLNESFGAFRELKDAGQLNLTQMQQLNPFLRSTDTNFPIAANIFSNPRYQKMYIAHMKTMINEIFSNNWYRQRALAIQSIINSYVQADPNKFYTYNDFLNNITTSVCSGPLAIVGLTELMNTRANYLLNRAEFQVTPPTISAPVNMPSNITPNSSVHFIVSVQNADSVFLGYRQNPAAQFRKEIMYDDGSHNDSLAGDGIYGNNISVSAGEINYYIYAENSEAASFYPIRAEYEYLTLPVFSSVVVNEMMAINDTTIPDPNGQYDDWIEFYNNSNTARSLDGYLLTNDSTNLTKWQFPDISIPAYSCLIIWADNDLNQSGLHANFKLTGSYGVLIFCDDDGNKLDQIIYGPQIADISLGRYPNGIGQFIFMHPTYQGPNMNGLNFISNTQTPVAKILQGAFPNPFRFATTIKYNLSVSGNVLLQVFDITGRQVASLINARQSAGNYAVNFSLDNQNVAQGIYFVRINIKDINNNFSSQTIKIISIK